MLLGLANLNVCHLYTVRGMMYYHKALQVQRLVEISPSREISPAEGWDKEMYWPIYVIVQELMTVENFVHVNSFA